MKKQNLNCLWNFSHKRLSGYLLPVILPIAMSTVSAQGNDNDPIPKDVLSEVRSSKFDTPRSTRSSQSHLTEGLVACYPFTGNANDASGNEFHGTTHGVTLTEDQLGKANRAYYFDGGSFINLGHSPSFNVNYHTITAWIKGENLHGTHFIIGKVTPKVHETISLYLNSNLLETSFATSTGANPLLTSQSQLENDKWYFVAFTYNGEMAKLYINGKLDNRVPRTGIVATNARDLAIGRHGGDSDQKGDDFFFHGSIDEVRIYNRALCASEIKTLYNLPEPGNCSSRVEAPASYLPDEGLLIIPEVDVPNAFGGVTTYRIEMSKGEGLTFSVINAVPVQ